MSLIISKWDRFDYFLQLKDLMTKCVIGDCRRKAQEAVQHWTEECIHANFASDQAAWLQDVCFNICWCFETLWRRHFFETIPKKLIRLHRECSKSIKTVRSWKYFMNHLSEISKTHKVIIGGSLCHWLVFFELALFKTVAKAISANTKMSIIQSFLQVLRLNLVL